MSTITIKTVVLMIINTIPVLFPLLYLLKLTILNSHFLNNLIDSIANCQHKQKQYHLYHKWKLKLKFVLFFFISNIVVDDDESTSTSSSITSKPTKIIDYNNNNNIKNKINLSFFKCISLYNYYRNYCFCSATSSLSSSSSSDCYHKNNNYHYYLLSYNHHCDNQCTKPPKCFNYYHYSYCCFCYCFHYLKILLFIIIKKMGKFLIF